MHKVKELYLFGSRHKGNFNNTSDYDFLVEIDEKDPVIFGSLFLSFYSALENYLERKVDLITIESIRNHLFEEHVLSNRKLIYGAESKAL